MDHRWSARKSVDFNVKLDHPALGVIEGSVKDVGLGGMFCKVRNSLLKVNTAVNLMFNLPEGDREKTHNVGAVVTYVTDDGVGMAFKNFEVSTIRSLRPMLYND